MWNGVSSERFLVKNGVKQGGVLSPVLFCVYINGLLERLYELATSGSRLFFSVSEGLEPASVG